MCNDDGAINVVLFKFDILIFGDPPIVFFSRVREFDRNFLLVVEFNLYFLSSFY
jgi:hypothetical protein